MPLISTSSSQRPRSDSALLSCQVGGVSLASNIRRNQRSEVPALSFGSAQLQRQPPLIHWAEAFACSAGSLSMGRYGWTWEQRNLYWGTRWQRQSGSRLRTKITARGDEQDLPAGLLEPGTAHQPGAGNGKLTGKMSRIKAPRRG